MRTCLADFKLTHHRSIQSGGVGGKETLSVREVDGQREPLQRARPSPARVMAFKESINLAEELMRRIDERWPAQTRTGPDPNTTYK